MGKDSRKKARQKDDDDDDDDEGLQRLGLVHRHWLQYNTADCGNAANETAQAAGCPTMAPSLIAHKIDRAAVHTNHMKRNNQKETGT